MPPSSPKRRTPASARSTASPVTDDSSAETTAEPATATTGRRVGAAARTARSTGGTATKKVGAAARTAGESATRRAGAAARSAGDTATKRAGATAKATVTAARTARSTAAKAATAAKSTTAATSTTGTGPAKRAGRSTAPAPEATEPVLPASPEDALVDALLGASRALVAVAERSLGGLTEEITLPQYRALVVLRTRGAQRLADLAVALDVNPSTATRMCDRLVRKGLVDSKPSPGDRRSVVLTTTTRGRRLVDQVSRRRKGDLAKIVGQMPDRGRSQLVTALRSFSGAAGDVPDQDWSIGWGR